MENIKKQLEPWFQKHNLKWLEQNTIFLTMHGSQAYGTNIATSDIDLKGICIPPKEYLLGFNHSFEQAEAKEPFDMVIYDLRKFFSLAANCNPNIIEVLFTDPKFWVYKTSAFEPMWENRHKFLSKKAKNTFFGYATAQLKRINTHKKWLMNPPGKQPEREAFGLPTQTKMSASDLGATQKLIDAEVPLETSVLEMFHREMKYQNALKEWQQYNSWKKTRNPKRASLEEQYGFDTKHAMHLVRLMRMCLEILEQGDVQVNRPDKEELLEIRSGKWDYEQLIEWADKQKILIDMAAEKSSLPEAPNLKELDAICVQMIEKSLG